MSIESKIIIGIDEVGRGPLAGPVVVAAVALPHTLKIKNETLKIPLRDSKKLTLRQRLAWYEWIKQNSRIEYAVARAYPKTIDRINISRAANKASHRAFKKLCFRVTTNTYFCDDRRRSMCLNNMPDNISDSMPDIILDGGLRLPKHIPQRTIIKADEKYAAVALASIVAKVARDRYMKKKHRHYPQYDFNQHKGYGTKKHVRAIKQYGPCSIHRKSFLSKILISNI